MTARPQSRSCVGASLGWTVMLLPEEVDTEAYDVSATLLRRRSRPSLCRARKRATGGWADDSARRERERSQASSLRHGKRPRSRVVTSTGRADQAGSELPRRTAYLQVRRHAREERVYRHALFVHQRCVELFPVVGRPRVAKAVDLAIEVIDDVLLRFIQLLLRGRWEQSLRSADLDLYLAADLPRVVAVPAA